MELQEMKTLWEDMSQKVDQQKILTDKLIMDLTQERYSNKIGTILIPEIIGTLICFAAALYIAINFGKLDVWYLQLAGIITSVACLILPVLSLKSIQKMKGINISKSTYKESLLAYTKGQKRFLQLQKIIFYLSFFLLFSAVIVFGKIFKDVDVFTVSQKLNWMIPSAIGALYIFTIWVYKKYKKATLDAKDILQELEN